MLLKVVNTKSGISISSVGFFGCWLSSDGTFWFACFCSCSCSCSLTFFSIIHCFLLEKVSVKVICSYNSRYYYNSCGCIACQSSWFLSLLHFSYRLFSQFDFVYIYHAGHLNPIVLSFDDHCTGTGQSLFI